MGQRPSTPRWWPWLCGFACWPNARPRPCVPAVHAYTEAIHPWIETQLLAADEQRQLGQDLLFSSAPADWHKSRELLQAAQACYERVQHHAEQVRQAAGHPRQRQRPFAGLLSLGGRPSAAVRYRHVEPGAGVRQPGKACTACTSSWKARPCNCFMNRSRSEPAHRRIASSLDSAHGDDVLVRWNNGLNTSSRRGQTARTLTPTEALSVWLDTESVFALPFVGPRGAA